MYPEDLSLLCCPETKEDLIVSMIAQSAEDGEILEGELKNQSGSRTYPVRNGIPRFVRDAEYNKSWDYKWTEIDQGKGLNYRILDKADPAYENHDIFDRNNHGGRAFDHARGRLALDIGCGIGQYSFKLMDEFGPEKLVSLDLTRGVDIFRKLMLERFPQYRRKILMVQASVFEMPFRDNWFDYVFSLGVLMHTGRTLEAIRQASRVVKPGGHVNFWVYCPIAVHLDVGEKDRRGLMTLGRFSRYLPFYLWQMAQVNLFRKLPQALVVRILKIFSSDFWYRLCRLPKIGLLFHMFFYTVMNPDRDYRYINNYDGWCNNWADTWTEQDLFPTLRNAGIVIRGISDWPTGIWGEKIPNFYS